jgi:acetyltransferase-like isoleucine patch superfamily enzyme
VGSGRIVLGREVEFGGKIDFAFNNRLRDRPEVHVGDATFIGHGCVLAAARSVRIGNHCLLAGGTRVADYDGHPLDAARRRAREPLTPDAVRPVVIGDDVWIGSHALILKGVTIGARSVVGAGSIVTKDVPPDVIVAGNPARVVKRLAPLELVNARACEAVGGRPWRQ